jgi:hypothetical protein
VKKLMTFVALLASFLTSPRSEAVVTEARVLAALDGRPAYCARDEYRRNVRENPGVRVEISKRKEVQALQAKFQGGSIGRDLTTGEATLEIWVRFQLISCVRSEQYTFEREWVREVPDSRDFAEALTYTGLFSGAAKRSKFTPISVVNMDTGEVKEAYTVSFTFLMSEVLTKKELKKFEEGEVADTTIRLRYRYERADSGTRPYFPDYCEPFRAVAARHPGRFTQPCPYEFGAFPASFLFELGLKKDEGIRSVKMKGSL